jgi:hypothetical protein
MIDVFYDPTDPGSSVLLKGSVGGPPWGYLIGAAMAGLGIVLSLKSE